MKLRCSKADFVEDCCGSGAALTMACRPRTVHLPLLKVMPRGQHRQLNPNYRTNPSGSWDGGFVP